MLVCVAQLRAPQGVLDGDDIVDSVAHDVGIEVFRTRYVGVAAYGAQHAVAALAVSDTG